MTKWKGRVIRLGVATMVALLTLFHVFLLWQRVVDGSFLHPAVAVEWALAAVLLVGFARIYQRSTLSRGRVALALWVLVLLLHVVTVVPGSAGSVELRIDKQLLIAMPLGVAATMAVLQMVRRLAGFGFRWALPERAESLVTADGLRFSLGRLSSFGPRAPPA